MRKIISVLKDMLAVILVLSVTFGAGYLYGQNAVNSDAEVVTDDSDNSDNFDLELPLEVEKRVVTVDEVESKLIEIGELSTFCEEYIYTLGKSETRYWMEKYPIWGSTNSIQITCKGIVKVGYNMSDIVVKVDDDKIYISIPEAKLNDNYVIWDSLECKESNNILNPIEFSQYEEIIAEIEAQGLQDVTTNGLYQKAEEHLKVLIEAFLSEFVDYEIIYM